MNNYILLNGRIYHILMLHGNILMDFQMHKQNYLNLDNLQDH